MSKTEMSDGGISQLNRRRFMKLSAAGVISLAALELLPGATKSASADTTNGGFEEKYQIFVPYSTARQGGSQAITLRSGDTIKVEIPRRLQENRELTVQGVGAQGNDVTLSCHTLYDTSRTTGDSIDEEINGANFIKGGMTKGRCNAIYESLKDGKFVGDLAALDLLDYIIESSKLEEDIRQRYSIASNNSRLKGIEDAIAAAFARSELDEERKKRIKGTYEYVRAGEPVPDFAALTDLNAIVAGSNLPEQLKQLYLTASAKSKAVTVDFIIVQLINHQKLSDYARDYYLSVWKKVRDGEKISGEEEKALESLDELIENSDISETSKTLYLVARILGEKSGSQKDPLQEAIEKSNKLTGREKQIYHLAYSLAVKGESSEQAEKEVIQYAVAKFHGDLSEAEEKAEEKDFAEYAKLIAAKLMEWLVEKADIPPAYRYASVALVGLVIEEKGSDVAGAAAAALVPTATSALSALGAEAGTGIAISSLSGGAATTATLAALGGGSVAAGGLGMLGGLVVVTGGAALIGAAGLVSVALLTQMDAEDYVNLGISGALGVLTSATVAIAVWTGAGALVAGSLSGAAAITTTISALGGLSVMTGGVALIALGVGFGVWSVLKGNKSRQDTLKELESRAYMLTEPSDDPLVAFVQKNLPKEYEHEAAYLAPAIPLDKLSNAISMYGYLAPGEKILALIDTSGFHDAKDGILLTDRSIIWRPAYSDVEYMYYSKLNWYGIDDVSGTMLESDWDKRKFAGFLNRLKEQVQG